MLHEHLAGAMFTALFVIATTILAAVGVPRDARMHGDDLSALLGGGADQGPDHQQHDGHGEAVGESDEQQDDGADHC